MITGLLAIWLVIPWVAPGAEVFIQNDDIRPIDIRLGIAGEFVPKQIPAHRVYRFTADFRGSLVIDSPIPLLAWSVVEGATFPAVEADTGIRSLFLTKDSALAVANPWDVPVRLTLWVYPESGDGTYINLTLGPYETRSGFRDAWIAGISEDCLVIFASEHSLAIGAVRYQNGRFETVPVRAIHP